MKLSVVPTGAALGAEIRGADLRQELDQATFQAVRDAFYKHELLIFRDHEISDADQIRFSSLFGPPLKLSVSQYLHKSYPEIFVVSNVLEEGRNIGSYDAGVLWHTDGAYLKQPHAISALRALEVPYRNGRALGDTCFASTSAAYEALPDSMKRRLEGLQAVNSVSHRHKQTVQAGVETNLMNDELQRAPEAVHPVVRIHPVTGRKCLFVTEGYTTKILNIPEDESRALLKELIAHVTRPEFLYKHSWKVNDLVMWDDCSTQHKATFDYELPLRRRMHRTTIGAH